MLSGEPLYPYAYFLERAALTFMPTARKALVIGLGPGLIPSRLARYGLTGTVVEIDPYVVEVAQGYFGFRQDAFKIAVADGRQFLESTHEVYDVALLDAFTAENEPFHLFTREAFQAVKRHLNPGGTLVINLAAWAPYPGADNRVLDSVLRTMREVFPDVRAFCSSRTTPGSVENFCLMGRLGGGSDGSPRAFLPVYQKTQAALEGFMATSYAPGLSAGAVYTDDWCPVEAQGASAKLQWREQNMSFTPKEILLD